MARLLSGIAIGYVQINTMHACIAIRVLVFMQDILHGDASLHSRDEPQGFPEGCWAPPLDPLLMWV